MPRNQGSTLVAYVVSGVLAITAFVVGIGGLHGKEINWVRYGTTIDVLSCLVLAAILFWWACWPDWPSGHEPRSKGKIGNETITMVVTIVTAVIAILTLTDGAKKNQLDVESARAKGSGGRRHSIGHDRHHWHHDRSRSSDPRREQEDR